MIEYKIEVINKIDELVNSKDKDKDITNRLFKELNELILKSNNEENINVLENQEIEKFFDFYNFYIYFKDSNLLIEITEIYLLSLKQPRFWKMMYSSNNIDSLIDIMNSLIKLALNLENLYLSYELYKNIEAICKNFDILQDSNEEFQIILKYLNFKNYKNILLDDHYKQHIEEEFNYNLNYLDTNLNLRVCGENFSECINPFIQYNLFYSLFPYYFKKYINKAKNKKGDFISIALSESLYILNKFIPRTQFYIYLDETYNNKTIYWNNLEEEKIIKNFPDLIYPLAIIINEIIIRPERITLNIKAFNILRRFYYLFECQRDKIKKSLKSIIFNILLFSTEKKHLKDISIFLLNDKHNIKNFKDLYEFDNNDSRSKILNKLIYSKYFNNKSFWGNKDEDILFNPKQLNLNCRYPLKLNIQPGNFKYLSFYSNKKSEKIWYYNFKLIEKNINYGIYKVNNYNLTNNLDEIVEFNQIIKELKNIDNTSIESGRIILKEEGLYIFLFDNTNSFFKEKNIYHEIYLLD